ncbi:MAG: DUF3330 domain-containing protein [Proteobacteria bacterium]|nr:MAG: DUF3330 domain-containing protein [Pseudomonadota bacterium]
MAAAEKSKDTQPIQCEICLREVPASEARVSEADDYIAHFCGLECYERWIENAVKDDDPEESSSE